MKKKKNLIDPPTTIFLWGKHQGETVEGVGEDDMQYLYYLRDSAQISDDDYLVIANFLENNT